MYVRKTKVISSLMALIFFVVSLLGGIQTVQADAQSTVKTAVSDECVEDIQVTLSIVSADNLIALPTELTVSYSTYSALGLTGIAEDDPGYITPLHVLAAYYTQIREVSIDNMDQYIQTDADGVVTLLEGMNGTEDNREGGAWRIAVNDILPAAEGEGLVPYTTANAPLTDKDQLTVFGIERDITKYYMTFKSAEYTVLKDTTYTSGTSNSAVAIELGTYNTNPTMGKANSVKSAKVLVCSVDDSGKLQPVDDSLYTASWISLGRFRVTMSQPGDYYIMVGGSLSQRDSSVSITKLHVLEDADQYAVDSHLAGINFYPAGKYVAGSSSFSFPWTSGNSEITSIVTDTERVTFAPNGALNSMMVNRSGLEEDLNVTVTITAKCGEATGTRQFQFVLLAALELEDMEVTNVDDFRFEPGVSQMSFGMPEASEIGIRVITKGNYPVTVSIGEEMVEDLSVPYLYQIDKEKFMDSVQVKITRSGIPGEIYSGSSEPHAISSIYTLNFCKPATGRPAYESNWPMARVDNWNRAAVNSLTPRSAEEIDFDASWAVETGGNEFYENGNVSKWGKWSYPMIVNNNIYLAVNSTLYKYDMDGKILAQASMGSTVLGPGYTGWLAYGDGMIFVPSGSDILAFNADDLTKLWVGSSGVTSGMQSSCPIIYKDGYIYSGTTYGTAGGGGYYCFDTTDEDPRFPNEIKRPVWCMEAGKGLDNSASFYWAGAAVIGNYLVVPCDDGYVYSVDLEASKSADGGMPTFADKLCPGGEGKKIRNSIVYDEERGRIMFNAAVSGGISEAALFVVPFDEKQGTFGEAVQVADFGTAQNSTVAYCYGRIYAYDAVERGIAVIDADTLKVIYVADSSMDDKALGLSSLSISTAYATQENDYTVYLYGNTNTNPNGQAVLKDSQTTTQGDLTFLNEVTFHPQYSTSQVYIADDGSLVFVNDSSCLYCLRSKVTREQVAVEQVIDKIAALPKAEDLTLEDEALVCKVRSAYDDLTEEQQAQVINVEVLNSAEAKVAELKGAEKHVFTDVNESDWFHNAVGYVYEAGLMTGTDEAKSIFAPYESLSRAEAAVVLYRMVGSPGVTYKDIFTDVEDHTWYTDAVLWADEAGIITRSADGRFNPAGRASREQMVTMLYRYAVYKGYDTSATAEISRYQDSGEVSSFAEDAVVWAVGNRILMGKYEETILDPRGGVSRAESAALLMRFMKTFQL